MFEAITTPKGPNWILRVTLFVIACLVMFAAISFWRIIGMPLNSFKGDLPPLSPGQTLTSVELSRHVRVLSHDIGERNVPQQESLQRTIEYLSSSLSKFGYTPIEQTYSLGGRRLSNVQADLDGTENAAPMLIVGAHYDSVTGTVGANDNGSGVAATLELARLLSGKKFRRTIRFVFFVNEEPPYFQTDDMGSLVYARQLRQSGAKVQAMLSLETIGFYSDSPHSQKYPPVLSWFYPDQGDFIGFVGNTESRSLVRKAIRIFRENTAFPSEGIAAPAGWPGIGWSDHWSFWQQNYPAIMITDTAVFRYPYYHTATDTIDKIDFNRMARAVEGVQHVVVSLADEP